MEESIFDIVDIDKILHINENNLGLEMSTCAQYHFHYAMLGYDAEHLEETFKLSRQAYEAEVAQTLKAEDAKGIMKEADLHRACFIDPKWMELNGKELEFHSHAKKLKAVAVSLDIKAKMLMSLNRRNLFMESKGMSNVPYNTNEDH